MTIASTRAAHPWLAVAAVTILYSASSASPTNEVLGMVSDADGPVAGAYVRLAHDSDREVVVVRSEADGKYRARGLAPGDWSVAVSAPSHPPMARTVTVGHGAVAQDFRLETGPMRTIHGVVRDPDGSPIVGQRVDAAGLVGTRPAAEIATAMTDSRGGYALSVAESTVDVALLRADRAPAERTVTIARGGDATVDFTLAPGGVIEGVVVGAKHAAIAKATVDVWIASTSPFVGTDAHVVTDSAGAFRLTSLGAGSYELHARAGRRGSDGATAVSLAAGEHIKGVELSIGARPTLRGTVVDHDGPVAGVDVDVIATHFERDAITDRAGRFELQGLPPGAFLVEALGDDPRSTRRDITLADRDLDIKLVLDDVASTDVEPEEQGRSSLLRDAFGPPAPPVPPSTCSASTEACCPGCTVTCAVGKHASCQPGSCVDESRVQSKVNQTFHRCTRQAACTCS